VSIAVEVSGTTRRIIVAITGASGAIYGVRLLEILRDLKTTESHMILSRAGRLTLQQECSLNAVQLSKLANVVHQSTNIGAPVASGSFGAHAMLIAPCSIKTASNIASGNTGDLISRAADVMLKERRHLVIAIRETPLHQGHLETLAKLAGLGAVIFPPVPSYYHHPESIDDLVNQTCMRLLDQIDVGVNLAPRWGEPDGIPAIGEDGGGKLVEPSD